MGRADPLARIAEKETATTGAEIDAAFDSRIATDVAHPTKAMSIIVDGGPALTLVVRSIQARFARQKKMAR